MAGFELEEMCKISAHHLTLEPLELWENVSATIMVPHMIGNRSGWCPPKPVSSPLTLPGY